MQPEGWAHETPHDRLRFDIDVKLRAAEPNLPVELVTQIRRARALRVSCSLHARNASGELMAAEQAAHIESLLDQVTSRREFPRRFLVEARRVSLMSSLGSPVRDDIHR